ncbi:hypothetical protein NQ318_011243 [Aromia moschata]|uniref:Uncharacterized protein n=1 Tax=Aromia moschata TaxID=1265417 RepID=A0AAV8YJQ7_9CUCU|nr:hypothetical protein NQ318_011243 [Aromia moschata]
MFQNCLIKEYFEDTDEEKTQEKQELEDYRYKVATGNYDDEEKIQGQLKGLRKAIILAMKRRVTKGKRKIFM